MTKPLETERLRKPLVWGTNRKYDQKVWVPTYLHFSELAWSLHTGITELEFNPDGMTTDDILLYKSELDLLKLFE